MGAPVAPVVIGATPTAELAGVVVSDGTGGCAPATAEAPAAAVVTGAGEVTGVVTAAAPAVASAE